MPELPEVETVRTGLAPVMEGAVVDRAILNRKNLRFPFDDDFVALVSGQKILELRRRAKYLLICLSNDQVIIAHLGMSGSFRTISNVDLATENTEQPTQQPGDFAHAKSKIAKHDHVVFELSKDGQQYQVIYNDPRRFGFMLLTKRQELDDHPMLASMGPEPTGNGVSTDYLAEKFMDKKAPIKSALLDQSIIAGLGNIYVCEALWRTGIIPTKQTSTLVQKSGKPTRKLEDLSAHIRDVIEEAIQAGGSSLNDHIQTDGSLGYFQHRFAVYGQEGEPCARDACEGIIKRITQSGRSSFYCPKCQK